MSKCKILFDSSKDDIDILKKFVKKIYKDNNERIFLITNEDKIYYSNYDLWDFLCYNFFVKDFIIKVSIKNKIINIKIFNKDDKSIIWINGKFYTTTNEFEDNYEISNNGIFVKSNKNRIFSFKALWTNKDLFKPAKLNKEELEEDEESLKEEELWGIYLATGL